MAKIFGCLYFSKYKNYLKISMQEIFLILKDDEWENTVLRRYIDMLLPHFVSCVMGNWIKYK